MYCSENPLIYHATEHPRYDPAKVPQVPTFDVPLCFVSFSVPPASLLCFPSPNMCFHYPSSFPLHKCLISGSCFLHTRAFTILLFLYISASYLVLVFCTHVLSFFSFLPFTLAPYVLTFLPRTLALFLCSFPSPDPYASVCFSSFPPPALLYPSSFFLQYPAFVFLHLSNS